jgi:hypothetical protein
MSDPRMLPLTPPPDSRRPTADMDYRERPASHDRPYTRTLPEQTKSDPPQKLPDSTSTPNIEAQKPRDLAGETTNPATGQAGPVNGASNDPVRSHPDSKQFEEYNRERPPPERYTRDEYGRPPQYYGADRRRSLDPREDPHARDYRGGYERDYYEYPPEYRGRESYPPPRGAPPLEYARGAPPRTSYEERYARGPVDLDPARDAYRDYPPRPDYGTKRKIDDPEYVDPYYDDYRVPPSIPLPQLKYLFFVNLTGKQRASRYAERPVDYPPRPPYESYDERDTKRIRGPPPEARDPVYDRPPPPAHHDRPPPPREYPAPSYTHRPPPPHHPARERTRPQGRYFLIKTSTAENIEKSRESVPPTHLFLVLTRLGSLGGPCQGCGNLP